jgi:hypothetical protein
MTSPRRTLRDVAKRPTAFAAFLFILAAAAIVVGLHDLTLDRASLGVTVGGAALLVVGVVVSVASYQLVQRPERIADRREPHAFVTVAFLLTLLLGLSMFFAAIRTSSVHWPAQWLVVAPVGLVLVGVALAGLWVFGNAPSNWLQRGATIALGLIATAIGAGEFWYQNQYAPSRAGRAVALKVDLHRTGEQRGSAYDVIRATVSYEGLGGRSVSVIGSTYTLTGSRVIRCHRPAAVKTVAQFFSGFLLDPQRSRFMADVWEIQPATVLAAGKFVADGKRLDPNVSSRRDFVFLVPRSRHYQLLRFRAQLFAIRASVQLSQRTEPTYLSFKGDNYLYGFWHVDDDSWLHDLIYGRERWVVLRYGLVSSPRSTATSPDLRVTARFPAPTWTKGMPSEAYVHRLFGIVEDDRGRFQNDPDLVEHQPSDASEPFADTELPLEGVAEPDAREIEFLKRHGVMC